MTAPHVVLVDYGASNMRSVLRALEAVGCIAAVARRPDEVMQAEAVVLPGVGAAGQMMRSLCSSGLDEAVRSFVASGRPFLGVCMGMQVLMDYSEEDGGQPCLGVLPGAVRRLPEEVKVPHMGWNTVEQRQPSWAWAGIPEGSFFYFVHSYAVQPADQSLTAGVTEHGVPFASAVARANLFGTQFHPEKSGRLGLQFYRNFLKWAST